MPTGSPFTSAQAPAAVQMLAPDIAAQQQQLARRQQLADMLRSQSVQQDQGTQVINGWAVKKSPLEGVAKMAQALMGGYVQKDTDEKQLALAKALQGRFGDFLGSGSGSGGGSASDPATTALAQGAAQQPSTPDETGAMVTQGGVGPTVQNAARMDALPPAQPAQPAQPATPNNFTVGNLLKGQVIGSLGGDQAASAYWDQFKPTDGMRNDKYLGITPDQSRTAELAKRLKEGYIPPTSLRGQAYTGPDGVLHTLPDAAQPGYMNKVDQATGEWSTAPIQGGLESVQGSEKAKALGKTLGTLGQGVDASGAPTFFLGVPNGASGAPAPQGLGPQMQAPQMQRPQAAMPPQGAMPQADASAQPPGAAPLDLNHMTPQQSKALMAHAQAQFGLRPGSAPGTSVQGPAPAQSAAPQAAPSAPLNAPASQSNMIRPGNSPGFNDYQQGLAKAASDRRSDVTKQAQDSPARINVLDNILDLSKAGVLTGPTADWTNKIKGIAADTFGIKDWKDDAAHYQEVVKFMSQNATRAWQAAGGSGTDAQLSQITKGNVNNGMFPQAVQGMAKYAKAGELALQGMTNAMQAANITDPKSQQQFESTWRQNMDPRIYQMKTMDPAEQQTFVANLKKTDPAGYQTLFKKVQTINQMGGL